MGSDRTDVRNSLPDQEPTPEGARVCPAVAGATNWPSTAFNPATGLYYLMAQESCAIYSKNAEWWKPGESFYGGTHASALRSRTAASSFARSISKPAKIAWEMPVEGGILQSGVMSTAGGLVFYGDGSGEFVALDAKTGKKLWHFQTGQSWKAGR